MNTVRYLDGREGILTRLDALRERVESGEIVSFAVAYITQDGALGGRWWTVEKQSQLLGAAIRGAVSMLGYDMDSTANQDD